ncbi:MAG: hypothetical protein EA398_17420 [Deltaproteobacteria bacterium]|nr:MAG: hypothetical protein EA398_17420 [Deltaproteobacteria bacterium]
MAGHAGPAPLALNGLEPQAQSMSVHASLRVLLHRDHPRRRDGIHLEAHRRREELDPMIDATAVHLHDASRQDPTLPVDRLLAEIVRSLAKPPAHLPGPGGLLRQVPGTLPAPPRQLVRTVTLAVGPSAELDQPVLRLLLDPGGPTAPELRADGECACARVRPPRGGSRPLARTLVQGLAAVFPGMTSLEEELVTELQAAIEGDDLVDVPPAVPTLEERLDGLLHAQLLPLDATAARAETRRLFLMSVRAHLRPVLMERGRLDEVTRALRRPAIASRAIQPLRGVHVICADNVAAISALRAEGTAFDVALLDPPYNTGNRSRPYDDAHETSTWLTGIEYVIQSLEALLHERGKCFTHIDDHHVSDVRLIFRERGWHELACVVVKMSELSGVKMTHAATRLPRLKEYVLAQGRSPRAELHVPRIPKERETLRRYAAYYTRIVRNPEDPPERWILQPVREAMAEEGLDPGDEDALLDYRIRHADRVVYRTNNRTIAAWRTRHPDAPPICRVTSPDGRSWIAWGDRELLVLSRFLDAPLGDLWLDISTINLRRELLGLPVYRGGQKPIALTHRLLDLLPDNPLRVLDPWAGSGTTGHAVLDVLAGGREASAVLVEVIPDVAARCTERLRRAAAAHDLPANVVQFTRLG